MADANGQDDGKPQGEAFGFAPAAKDEKYNTQYLVASMNKEKRVGQIVIVGGFALVLGVIMWFMMIPGKGHQPPGEHGAPAGHAAPAEPAKH